MRYFLYCIILAITQLVTWIVTPILPLFSVYRGGWCNNNQFIADSYRLPKWLSWFDTPDNSLCGDQKWEQRHTCSYWSKVAWLYRNSLYGFKWSILSLPVGHTDAWQWHKKFYFKYFYLDLNFGWMLDNIENGKAMFQFSPRIKRLYG